MMSKLNGLKTYIAACITMLTGLGVVVTALSGDVTSGSVMDGVQLFLTGASVFTLRHGIEKGLGDK